MHTRTYSNYKLETYVQCKRKYYYTYFAKVGKYDGSRPYLMEGSFSHDVLRQYRSQLQHMKNGHFRTRFDVMADSYRMFLNMYDTTLFDPRKCRTYLYDYLKKYKNEPINNSIELEERFEFPFSDIKLIGSCDRIDQLGENSYEIIDYKTTSKPEYLDKSLQPAIYFLHGKNKYGDEADIKVSYILLSLGCEKKTINKNLIEAKIFEIIPTVKRIVNEEKWREKLLSPLCDYCEFVPMCFPNSWADD